MSKKKKSVMDNECIKRTKLRKFHKRPVKKYKRSSYMMLRNIPTTLRDKFKAHCVERGWTATGKIRDLMRQVLKGEIE